MAWRKRLQLCVLCLCALGALAVSQRAPLQEFRIAESPAKPHAEFANAIASPGPIPNSPYLNTAPEVAYVGSQRCATCHEAIAQSYAATGMGRSSAPASSRFEGGLDPGQSTFVHAKSGFSYAVRESGTSMVHEEFLRGGDGAKTYSQSHAVDWAIGSGKLGASFLINRNGYLFESPITWYRDVGWALSPGYDAAVHSQFARPATLECLACHADRVALVKGAVNRFDSSVPLDPIGCERCHGPGQLHVNARLADGGATERIDRTIVNPRRLPTELRDQVCQQCHLEGDVRLEVAGRSLMDYRPGLPLDAFRAVFSIPPTGENPLRVVGHVEGMQRSRCFQQTRDWPAAQQFQCTSCHDPHARPSAAKRVAYYRGRCLACHGGGPQSTSAAPCCTLEASRRHGAQDNCTYCHMPTRSAVGLDHSAITDHYVRVVRESATQMPEVPSEVQMLPFHRAVEHWPEALRNRYLGIAYHKLATTGSNGRGAETEVAAERFMFSTLRKAAGLLRAASEDFPADSEVWEALASVYQQFDRYDSSQEAARTALALDPGRVVARAILASLHRAQGELAQAEEEYARLVEADAYNWYYWMQLGAVRAELGRSETALQAYRNALRANSGAGPVHRELGALLIEKGQRRQGIEHLQLFFRLPSMDGTLAHPAADANARRRSAALLESAQRAARASAD